MTDSRYTTPAYLLGPCTFCGSTRSVRTYTRDGRIECVYAGPCNQRQARAQEEFATGTEPTPEEPAGELEAAAERMLEAVAAGATFQFVSEPEPQESVREYNRRMRARQAQLLELAGEVSVSPKLGEVLAAADRRYEAGEFSSWAEALRQVYSEAEGEPRLEGVEPPELEEPGPLEGASYEAWQAWTGGPEPEPQHPLLAAASALGLPDCAPGCTCRGATTTTPSMLADASQEA